MMGREHISNMSLLNDIDLASISDACQDSLIKSSGKATDLFGKSPNCYNDYKVMLSTEKLDAVIIASPNHHHFEQICFIFENYPDLAVLLEKPAVTRLDDCTKLLVAQEKHKAPVWVAMEYRYIPVAAELIARLRDGAVGKLQMFSMKEHRFPFLSKVGDWNRFSDQTGGTLVEKCCHFFDLMRHVIGREATQVYCSGGVDVNHLDEVYNGRKPDILDNAFVVVEFEGGIRAMLELCMFAEGSYFQEELTVIGDKAKLEAKVPAVQRFWPGALDAPDQAPKPELVYSPRDPKGPITEVIEADQNILAAGDHQGSTFYQHQKFLACVKGEGDVEVTLRDGLSAVLIGLAAEQSAKKHQPIIIEKLGE